MQVFDGKHLTNVRTTLVRCFEYWKEYLDYCLIKPLWSKIGFDHFIKVWFYPSYFRLVNPVLDRLLVKTVGNIFFFRLPLFLVFDQSWLFLCIRFIQKNFSERSLSSNSALVKGLHFRRGRYFSIIQIQRICFQFQLIEVVWLNHSKMNSVPINVTLLSMIKTCKGIANIFPLRLGIGHVTWLMKQSKLVCQLCVTINTIIIIYSLKQRQIATLLIIFALRAWQIKHSLRSIRCFKGCLEITTKCC